LDAPRLARDHHHDPTGAGLGQVRPLGRRGIVCTRGGDHAQQRGKKDPEDETHDVSPRKTRIRMDKAPVACAAGASFTFNVPAGAATRATAAASR
jgi:hypothetical protein